MFHFTGRMHSSINERENRLAEDFLASIAKKLSKLIIGVYNDFGIPINLEDGVRQQGEQLFIATLAFLQFGFGLAALLGFLGQRGG